jgi:hypothetical protein
MGEGVFMIQFVDHRSFGIFPYAYPRRQWRQLAISSLSDFLNEKRRVILEPVFSNGADRENVGNYRFTKTSFVQQRPSLKEFHESIS